MTNSGYKKRKEKKQRQPMINSGYIRKFKKSDSDKCSLH